MLRYGLWIQDIVFVLSQTYVLVLVLVVLDTSLFIAVDG